MEHSDQPLHDENLLTLRTEQRRALLRMPERWVVAADKDVVALGEPDTKYRGFAEVRARELVTELLDQHKAELDMVAENEKREAFARIVEKAPGIETPLENVRSRAIDDRTNFQNDNGDALEQARSASVKELVVLLVLAEALADDEYRDPRLAG